MVATVIWTATGDILPQAIGAALNPITITLCLLILLSDRGRVTGPAFAVGVVATSFAAVGLTYLLTQTADVDNEAAVSNGVNVMQLVFGVALLVLAFRKWSRRVGSDEPAPRPKIFDSVARLSVPGAFALGVVGWSANIKSIPLAVSAGARVAQGPTDGVESLVVLGAFALVASIFVVVPVLVFLVRGERSRATLQAAEEWVVRNLTAIVVTVMVVLGVVLVGNGLAVLD